MNVSPVALSFNLMGREKRGNQLIYLTRTDCVKYKATAAQYIGETCRFLLGKFAKSFYNHS